MTPASYERAAALAAHLEDALAPLEVELNRAWWAASTDATPEHQARQAEAERAVRDFYGDPEAFAELSAALEDLHPDADPVLRRRLELLRQGFVPNQVDKDLRDAIVELETSVHGAFSSFRGSVDGRPVTDNDIAEILDQSDDTGERRAAWEASKQVGAAVADRVRELSRLRNDAARRLGYRDHYALALEVGDLDERRLFDTLAAVDRATAAPFRDWKAALDARLADRFGVAPDELGPWHYGDPFFQQAPRLPEASLDGVLAGADIVELAARTYDGIGLDARAVVERSDLYPREGKTQHAFAIDIDRSGDARVLCNVAPTERWAETTLHELGHAVYDLGIDRALPWTLRTPAHALSTEGVAMWFGRLVRDPQWLASVAGVPGPELERLRAPLAETRRAMLLVFARWVLVMMHFERGLYADPDGDHDARWWELVERFQGVRRPAGRHEPDWAAKIHVALAPVYYQNYLYGELFASQVDAALAQRAGRRVGDPEVGRFLRERVFRPGASLRWDRLVEQATHAPLSVEALVADLAG